MFKSITYNVDFRPSRKKSVYSMEYAAMHDFLASDNENMCFEYNNNKEAANAYQAIWTYAKKNRQPLTVSTRQNTIVITKNTEE